MLERIIERRKVKKVDKSIAKKTQFPIVSTLHHFYSSEILIVIKLATIGLSNNGFLAHDLIESLLFALYISSLIDSG